MWELSQELINAFPSYLKEDILYIEKNTKSKSNLSWGEYYGVRGGFFRVIVNNEELTIPERHNLKEIQQQNILDRIFKKDIVLSDTQNSIIDCFYTRHCDGFIREKYCKNILQQSLNHEWIVPYVLHLTGEYVVEIQQIIFSHLEQLDTSIFINFILNNKKFYELIKQRVQSYWNCYYRSKYPKKEDYPGFKILEFFDKNLPHTISR